ncbi:MAG: hypothetical protein ACW968_16910 [Candidatus Thorarchaeota archaeon]|jgi:hypothetical protein
MGKIVKAVITRQEAAMLVNELLDCDPSSTKGAWHVGRVEFRVLLDAIYGGPPQLPEEKIK